MVNGNRDIADYLLEKTDRAVVKAVDRDGRSALHYAAAFAQEDDNAMFGWLMMMGADKSQADNVRFDKKIIFYPPSSTISSHLKKGMQLVPIAITE